MWFTKKVNVNEFKKIIIIYNKNIYQEINVLRAALRTKSDKSKNSEMVEYLSPYVFYMSFCYFAFYALNIIKNNEAKKELTKFLQDLLLEENMKTLGVSIDFQSSYVWIYEQLSIKLSESLNGKPREFEEVMDTIAGFLVETLELYIPNELLKFIKFFMMKSLREFSASIVAESLNINGDKPQK